MNIQVIRATETWQQAGAYYVRIQGMAKQHGITLRREFDEHDVAVSFYEKLGYTVTDTNIIHGNTFDVIKMEKKL